MTRKSVRFKSTTTVEERRLQILQDATALFAQHGFHATSMREICKAARLSAGAMYHYFSGKDEIITAMIAMDRARTTAAFADLPSTSSVIEVLTHLTAVASQDFQHHGFLTMWTEINAEVARNDQVRGYFLDYYEEVHGKVTQLIRSAQKRGEVRTELKPAEATTLIMAVYDGIMCRCAIDKEASFKKLSKQALGMIQLLLQPLPSVSHL